MRNKNQWSEFYFLKTSLFDRGHVVGEWSRDQRRVGCHTLAFKAPIKLKNINKRWWQPFIKFELTGCKGVLDRHFWPSFEAHDEVKKWYKKCSWKEPPSRKDFCWKKSFTKFPFLGWTISNRNVGPTWKIFPTVYRYFELNI